MTDELKEPMLNNSEQEPYYEQMQKPLNFMGQSGLLIWKNLILTIKNPKNLIFLLITPFILSLFMAIFRSLADDNASRTLENPPERAVPNFPACIGKNCISLEYAIISSPDDTSEPTWVTEAIKFVKKKSGLKDDTFRKYSKPITTMQGLKDYYKTY